MLEPGMGDKTFDCPTSCVILLLYSVFTAFTSLCGEFPLFRKSIFLICVRITFLRNRKQPPCQEAAFVILQESSSWARAQSMCVCTRQLQPWPVTASGLTSIVSGKHTDITVDLPQLVCDTKQLTCPPERCCIKLLSEKIRKNRMITPAVGEMCN